ncbi:MAG TPA: DNA-3-methyladenine glycosylase 2 family protein [Rhodanobacteraceae bacterium]|jgi:DNA-3-methyladenine glycosylase II|nr:DNA-3-methyladenine glycosylase 2 family protein [Rhodanobacteraceae bacterium]
MTAAAIPRGFDVAAARAHLQKRDRKLARWMQRIGPIEHDFAARFDPVDALARSIIHQQLSGKVVRVIEARVEALMPRRGRITPSGIEALDDASLRGAGISGNKLAALRDLAAKSRAGIVPTQARLDRMGDEELIERLTQVRGIGRWTVEMLLMFRLGRPDVLPVDDLGVRKGAQIVHGFDAMPAPRALREFGERWAPYRTLAGLYLWRVVEAASAPKVPAKRAR